MNEVQLIRGELAGQRRRTRELAASQHSQSRDLDSDISSACGLYFVLTLALESSRVESHLARLRIRSDLSAGERRVLERCAREFEALAADAARAADKVTRLSTLVEQLEAIAESRYGVDEWRRAAHVDADSILEERRLHAQALREVHGPASD